MLKKGNIKEKIYPIYGTIDERTRTVVYQGDAYTGRFMLFAVLLDVMIRSLVPDNSLFASNWDLMIIVIIGGLISTVYQIKNKVISNSSSSRSFIIIISLASVFTAFLLAFFLSK